MLSQHERTPAFHLASRSKSYSHKASNSFLSSMPRDIHECTTLSLDLEGQRTGYPKEAAISPEVRLRGGAGRLWPSKFEWLNPNKALKETALDKCETEQYRGRVTYKGKDIGLPQLAPAFDVLPPTSRFVREPEAHTASPTARTLFRNSDGADNSPATTRQDYPSTAYLQTPLQPPPRALLPTPSRPATTNPFAGVYGNPYATRTGPASPPIEYEIAGSLVDRPNALDGSQTDYASSFGTRGKHAPQTDGKWGALPPLPAGEGTQAPLPVNGIEAGDEPFDTEEVLASLRPQRLGLHHVAIPLRLVAGSTTARDADACSIRTRDWDLQSCDTTDLGIDNRLQRHQQQIRRSPQRPLPEEQRYQLDIQGNGHLVDGLPQEDATNPESWFYAEMIEIVNNYHEQLQSVVQGAYEGGQISEEQWVREKWINRMVLDRKLRIAEDMSGYKIFTNEHDIKQAIQHPTGYAIYSSLLKIRDPKTWQRVFEPSATYAHLGTITSTSQRHVPAPMSTFLWLMYKVGRGLRFMLAVPDDPDLKTHSSRHPPASDTVTYKSNVGVLGPNIPFRPQGSSAMVDSAATLQSSASRDFMPHDQPRTSTQTERTPKISTDTTRVNNNTTLTGVTLASPLNGRITVVPRGLGYDQGTFVTNLTPSIVSKESEKTTAGYGAGKATNKKSVMDGGSEITAWPEAEC